MRLFERAVVLLDEGDDAIMEGVKIVRHREAPHLDRLVRAKQRDIGGRRIKSPVARYHTSKSLKHVSRPINRKDAGDRTVERPIMRGKFFADLHRRKQLD